MTGRINTPATPERSPARARLPKNLSEGITIRFDPETLGQLRRQAHRLGIGPTTLVRIWILERLRDRQTRPSP